MTPLLAAALALAYPQPIAQVDDAVPPDSNVEIVERLGKPIPHGLRFVDADGRAVTLDHYLRGRPVVLGLVYYRCPVLCGLLLSGLAKAIGELDWRLGRDFDVVTVSIDPGEPPSLAKEKQRGYLQAVGQPASDGWAFLTGKVDDIDTLSEAVGMRYQYVARQRQFAHAAALYVLTPDGRISRYLYGVEFPEKQLKLALFEAAGGRVGTSFERVLLRCYRYDPASRKYELFVARYFRAGGAIMVLAIGLLLGGLWRRELRRARGEAT
jgi:protein SCO1/2